MLSDILQRLVESVADNSDDVQVRIKSYMTVSKRIKLYVVRSEILTLIL